MKMQKPSRSCKGQVHSRRKGSLRKRAKPVVSNEAQDVLQQCRVPHVNTARAKVLKRHQSRMPATSCILTKVWRGSSLNLQEQETNRQKSHIWLA